MVTSIYNYDSYWLHMNSINSFTTLQNQIADTSNLINTKAKNYMTIVADGLVEQADSATSNLRVTEVFIKDNESIISRVMQQGTQIDLMQKGFATVASLVTAHNKVVAVPGTMATAIETISKSVEAMLNYSNGSGFLFGGSKTNIQPVQNATDSTNIVNGVPSSNYFHGDDVIRAAQVSKYQNVSYGITADHRAFVQFFAAVHMAIQADHNGDDDALLQAKAYIETAISELASLGEVNVGVLASMQDINKNMAFQQLNFATMQSRLLVPDLATESTRLKMLSDTLEIAYATYAKISSLSLAAHLAHR
jgi:flagellin-like hook-associated protein FlgL